MFRHAPFALVLLIVAGCGKSGSPEAQPRKASMSASRQTEGGVAMAPQAGQDGVENVIAKPPAEAKEDDRRPAVVVSRKIIHNADVSLVVQDFDAASEQLPELVKSQQGFVAKSEVTGSTGMPRSGHWRVRLPVSHYQDFLSAIVKLGVPEKNTTDSQDVTDEYYDFEARIKNKKVEEERLLKHLEKSTGKLEEILAVEREINRVRGEVERLQGRLRVLANQTELTTVTVTMREVKNYVPPQSPSFSGNIVATFSNSFDLLTEFGKGLIIFFVAIAPWVPLLALCALPAWLYVRRRRRQHA